MEFNALVLNTLDTNNGEHEGQQLRGPRSSWPTPRIPFGRSIREPRITNVDKQVLAPLPQDAGDTAHYR